MLTLFVNQYLSQEEDNDQLVAIFNVHPEILATADNVSMSQVRGNSISVCEFHYIYI
jgi:hypothetical protein